jgi:hypothetical protein
LLVLKELPRGGYISIVDVPKVAKAPSLAGKLQD